MEKYDVFRELVNAYPFVYRTEQLGTKFMGFAVFRDCTTDEKKMYEEYCSKLRSVSDFENYEKSKEYDELIEALVKVEKAVECEPRAYNSEKIGEICFELSDGLAKLPQSELKEIDSQYKDFLKVRSLRVRRDIEIWETANRK